MKKLQFKCKLLSDVILNQKSATEGNRTTLDFIPGNNFLGIVASQLYDSDAEKSMILFHTGDVKYGDAHPSIDQNRGLKIPASMYYPKLGKLTEECYIHYLIPDLSSEQMKNMQLKQCRSGFYCFDSSKHIATEVSVKKSFAIKSAFDKELRRSKDSTMYGYESLRKGTEFLFEVSLSEKAEKYENEIKNALTQNQKRIGRSHSAQYGLVDIEEYSYSEPQSCNSPITIDKIPYIVVYADSRLIFLDEYGIPTYQPSARDLGLNQGSIDWSKSQIRIFQYAPWNNKRQAYDTDRCGIEKGSIFLIRLDNTNDLPLSSSYVGVYQNEGFGKVIYNPDFLQQKPDSQNGEAYYQIKEAPTGKESKETENSSMDVNPLLSYLTKRQEEENFRYEIYEQVNSFVSENKAKFADESFSSQWGNIRNIAMKGDNIKDEIITYLKHGVAKEKWTEGNRIELLEKFMEQIRDIIDEVEINVNNQYFQEAIINLSSEMAKACRKG